MLPRRGGVVSPAQRVSAKARGCRRPRRLQLWVLTSCAACCSVVLFIAFVVALPSSALHAAARGWRFRAIDPLCVLHLAADRELAASTEAVLRATSRKETCSYG